MSFTVTDFTRGDRTIRLYGVSHVSTAENYLALYASLREDKDKGFVIHHEGVQAPPRRAAHLKAFYAAMARTLNLDLQLPADRTWMENHDIKWHVMSLAERAGIATMFTLARTLGVLTFKALAHSPQESKDQVREALLSLPTSGRTTPDNFFTRRFDPLMRKREKIAGGAAMNAGTSVSMVWGAAHVRGLADLFTLRGWEQGHTRELKGRCGLSS